MEIPPRPKLQLLSHRPERQNQNIRYLMISGTSKRALGAKVSHRVEWRPVCSKKQIKTGTGASLVVQWLGVCLPMQGTRVRVLVWEDPTCRGAAGSVSHNC